MTCDENETKIIQFEFLKHNREKTEELFEILCKHANIQLSKCNKQIIVPLKSLELHKGKTLHDKIANFINDHLMLSKINR